MNEGEDGENNGLNLESEILEKGGKLEIKNRREVSKTKNHGSGVGRERGGAREVIEIVQ